MSAVTDVLERGNIYFFYRPRVEEKDPEGLDDVQRTYIVLEPHGKNVFRRLVIGQKKLPRVDADGDPYWAFVDFVNPDPRALRDDLAREAYETETRGTRRQPAARPAAEGVYALVRHEDHTHLAYVLELPHELGPVQDALNVEREASFVVSVKNPQAGAPPDAGLGNARQADYPAPLQARFEDRRFAAVDPPDYLDHEGAEIVIAGASAHAERELGVELKARDDENEERAEIINNLYLTKKAFKREPLLMGAWA